MLQMPMKKRLSQLFCKHNYFVVAVADNYQNPGSTKNEKAIIYECNNCEHVKINKKEK